MFNYNTSGNPYDSLSDDELIASSDLYPELPPEERIEAIRNLYQYFEIIYEIWLEQEASGKLVSTLEEIQLHQAWEKRFVKKDNESYKQRSSKPTRTKSDAEKR